MIRLLDLNDKTYKQLVEDAVSKLRIYAPQWTDYNSHDPGITLIEMLAWLNEMQNYYLNRITDQNYIKFLKLTGVKLLEPSQASAYVCFKINEDLESMVFLNKGTRIYGKGIPFETTSYAYLHPIKLERVYRKTPDGFFDKTEAEQHEQISYKPFGRFSTKDCSLYLGFFKERGGFSVGKPISMFFDMGDRKSVDNKDKSYIKAPVKLAWEYYCIINKADSVTAKWMPLDVLNDETFRLSNSGIVTVRVPEGSVFIPYSFDDTEPDERFYWMRVRIISGKYDYPPELLKIYVNASKVKQKFTHSKCYEYHCNLNNKCVKLTNIDLLQKNGKKFIQIKNNNGFWTDVSNECVNYLNDMDDLLIDFSGADDSETFCRSGNNFRLTASWNELISTRGTGLENQSFVIDVKYKPIIKNLFKLQVNERVRTKKGYKNYWVDWQLVDDFCTSTHEDRHFTIDSYTGRVSFGDGINGAVPKAPCDDFDNIRVISLTCGGGVYGNLDVGEINQIEDFNKDEANIKCRNFQTASGGTEKESISEGVRRLRTSIREVRNAVTTEDYEKSALATPGQDIARVLVKPNYKLAQSGDTTYAPTVVTVVVVPKSIDKMPLPGKVMLSNVKKFLCRKRLIGTQLNVIKPHYAEVTVSVNVVYKLGYKRDKKLIANKINEFLSPMNWEFGKTVYKSEIYELLDGIKGIDYVEDVEINAYGDGFLGYVKGNVRISEVSLVYSGCHKVKIIESV